MECLTYCVANAFDLSKLDQFIKKDTTRFHAMRLRDVLKIYTPDQSQLIFVFKNGTLVTWGLKRHQAQGVVDLIKQFSDRQVNYHVHDEFSYRIGSKTSIEPHDYFDVDIITLDDDNEEIKLSFAYGLSQSVKLQYFETVIDALIEKYNPYIRSLSQTGEMPLSRNQIRQVIGEILGAKSEMNLISNFLYHPKFFWQHPTLEVHYVMLERYLHIPKRVNAINHRLDTLNEIFDMFNAFLENRHAHSLEIIIIVLISIEIIFAVLNFHF